MVTFVWRQTFTVIEFCPREPSAYVQSAYWLVLGENGQEYAIDAGDLDVYEGRCPDCQQKHDEGDCHYDQEPPDEGDCNCDAPFDRCTHGHEPEPDYELERRVLQAERAITATKEQT